jgi:nicotinate-nucleotide--dimethylbenzimidazole phosphoribosyltransferase
LAHDHDHAHGPQVSAAQDFAGLLAAAPMPDEAAADKARAGCAEFGAAAGIAAFVAGWRGSAQVRRAIVCLYASSFEQVEAGKETARLRLEHLAAGGGAISGVARALGAGVEVFDLALDRPVRDAGEFSAASDREVAATMAFGLEALAKEPDFLVLGDLTVGSERAAAAFIAMQLRLEAAEAAADADEAAWLDRVLKRARAKAAGDVITTLAEVGGREIAALAGAIIAARVSGVPVVLSSPAALAAALAVDAMAKGGAVHCRLAAAFDHPAVRAAAAALDLVPLIGAASTSHEGVDGLYALLILRQASGGASAIKA